jgi:hypothetical protein
MCCCRSSGNPVGLIAEIDPNFKKISQIYGRLFICCFLSIFDLLESRDGSFFYQVAFSIKCREKHSISSCFSRRRHLFFSRPMPNSLQGRAFSEQRQLSA